MYYYEREKGRAMTTDASHVSHRPIQALLFRTVVHDPFATFKLNARTLRRAGEFSTTQRSKRLEVKKCDFLTILLYYYGCTVNK